MASIEEVNSLFYADEIDEAERQEHLDAIRVSIENDMWGKMLTTYEGRHVLYNIIAMGDIYDIEGPMPLEPNHFNRAQGRKEVALSALKRALTVDPNVYILMQKEASDFNEKFRPDLAGSKGQDDNG
jgi:hypothetical protein